MTTDADMWKRVAAHTWVRTIDGQLWTVTYNDSDETYTVFKGEPHPTFCERHGMPSLTDAQRWVERNAQLKPPRRYNDYPRGYDEAAVADMFGDDCACGYDARAIVDDPEGHAERHWMLSLPPPPILEEE